ncbi:MAG: phosphate ABC transporter permease PstA [Brevinematales bacterium]|nr:phosphate ABC transporter permease PstA [Brevinematales bacterium]
MDFFKNKVERKIIINIIKEKIFFLLIFIFSITVIFLVFIILFYIFKKGIMNINIDLFIHNPKPTGEPGGGVLNAIVGSLILVFFASLIAIPIGVMSGIYLSDAKKSRFIDTIRLFVDVLQSVPSIVIGIVVYGWLVVPMKSFSAISGSVALAIMMLPVIIKNTEETLKLIPYSIKEAAYALGVPYYKVVLKVVLPCGISGIVTGIIVALARIIGETAPLLFTAFGNHFFSTSLFKPIEAIPHIIFKYATSPYEDWQNIAWGASLLLVIFVLSLNFLSKVVLKKWKVKF